MVLKVDLQCHRCYKKVKKILCKIPRESLSLFLCNLSVVVIYLAWLLMKQQARRKGKGLSTFYIYMCVVVLNFVNKRNSRPEIRREAKHSGNQSGVLLPGKD
jgi:hypothetical protein